MALLNEILSLSTELPVWQQDAIRRLFLHRDLKPRDYDDFYAFLKMAHGIPDPQNRQPIPLAAEHIPAENIEATVILKAMHDLQHVNRLAPGKPLTFSPTGITVIYGGNSSGKSGYSRVLKQACRARDQAEDVLTDATNSAEVGSTPEATFDIEIDATPQSVKWVKGTLSPDELSTITVFDTHCARAYLKEGEAAYLPYGMDIVVNLGDKIIPYLNRMLTQEISTISTDRTPFNHLLGETSVGKLLATLSHIANPTEINTLAALSETEILRIDELKAVLSETDPKTKASELNLSARRIKDVATKVDTAFAWVKDEAIGKFKTYYDEALDAKNTETSAAKILRADENLLPGTGEQIWKSLFEAARKFSTKVAYQSHPFPYTGSEAVCPLCQQPFSDEGKRLIRFEKYIQDDAARVANEKRRLLNDAKMEIEQIDVTIIFNEAIILELSSLNQKLVSTIKAFESSLEARRSWMLKAATSGCWDNIPQFSENPKKTLQDLVAKQLTVAQTLIKATDEAKKKKLIIEYNELIARQNLKVSLQPILALLDRMKFKASLERCNNDLDTRPISNASKRLATTVVTPFLRDAIDNEFKMLGIEHIKTKLNQRTTRGKPQYRLLLDLPTTHKLEAILSEGEQRAISIGSFLAELQLANHKGGIVFDDPVSSLDHNRRMRVANRIVKEAAHRQVIVFTHDTVFLGQLCDEIKRQKIANLVHHLEWEDGIPGYIHEGLPWEHQGYKARLNMLKQNHKRIEKDWQVYPSEKQRKRMRQQYNDMRATIERAISNVVLNDVIKPYRGYIQAGKLVEVGKLTQDQCAIIKGLYNLCENIVDAHDTPSAQNASVPTPTELGNDIIALETVIQEIKDDRK